MGMCGDSCMGMCGDLCMGMRDDSCMGMCGDMCTYRCIGVRHRHAPAGMCAAMPIDACRSAARLPRLVRGMHSRHSCTNDPRTNTTNAKPYIQAHDGRANAFAVCCCMVGSRV